MPNNKSSFLTKHQVRIDDILIITIMAVLAGCGLIYEYLLSHYAARVVGAVESTIFAMIGTMIVSMGLGAFAAKKLKDPFSSFAWLELAIAIIGLSAVFLIALTFSFANTFPQLIAETYGLPPDLQPQGGISKLINHIATISPYFTGFLLGFLIGIEIPLIAKIREEIYQTHIKNNAGTVYGADYIGAGIGAAIWVLFMLSMEISTAAAVTASTNLLAGLVFYFRYHTKIRYSHLYLLCQLILIASTLVIFKHGPSWELTLESTLYKDKVMYSAHTKYQHVTVTERIMDPRKAPIYSLYINGRTQFSSVDEAIYHEMLVHPAMAASAKHKNILIVGGGDGLAAREVLKWKPESITLLDLDQTLVNFFSQEKFDEERGFIINKPLLELNQHALTDSRVNILFGDAFNKIDDLLNKALLYDTIIVDLPDPSHPDLNKLYSDRFYEKLSLLLTGDGALVIQSTSPYHAKDAFLSIGKTVKAAGLLNVEQYHTNVPSFGEWGWTIATKNGQSALNRLKSTERIPLKTQWLTLDLARSAFNFPKNYFAKIPDIKINTLGSHTLYNYHQRAWQKEQGIYNITALNSE
jgi:spermidine synthase